MNEQAEKPLKLFDIYSFGVNRQRMIMPPARGSRKDKRRVVATCSGATVISTSTRNFPNRLGRNTNVFLGSAELAAIASRLGHLPTPAEYLAEMGEIDADKDSVYRYMNFNEIEEYVENAKNAAVA